MDEQAKKTALRMIPYGLFVLGVGEGQQATASTVNWITQASFQPPIVVVGVKGGTETYDLVKATGKFAISVLGTGQRDIAFAYFKHVEPEGNKLAGYEFETKTTGAPIIVDAPAWFECEVRNVLDVGDHSVVVGEVIEAGVHRETDTLTLKEVGVNYGG
ncbi:MAG: flavin reductase family protein [Dehalococcoidia bacterium]|nr:flavin reductase family protein [Dehalococcoidia bacterium]